MRKLSIILLLFLSAFSFANNNSINEMNKKIKNIDKEIEKKNTRIKNINTQTSSLEKEIKNLEEEIKKIDTDREEIEKEIEIVKKNIDYGEKNLEISIREHERKELEYIAKILAWNKFSNVHSKEIGSLIMLKKNYREILHGDLQRMEYIEKITGSIKETKEKIETEKKKLDVLRKKLQENAKKSNAKKQEHTKLIQKLAGEKKNHQSTIAKLQKEKQRISKEIERIIKENAKKQQKNNKTKPAVSISDAAAYKKIGKTLKPVAGEVVVSFKQKKAGVVESNGIEIKGKVGANVIAAKAGRVIYSDKFQGLGKVVMIDYGDGIIGVYGNLIATKVSLNAKVSSGQTIGALGLSSDKEPNLYYELRVNLKPIDPLPTFK